jgi:hypothetical protein
MKLGNVTAVIVVRWLYEFLRWNGCFHHFMFGPKICCDNSALKNMQLLLAHHRPVCSLN